MTKKTSKTDPSNHAASLLSAIAGDSRSQSAGKKNVSRIRFVSSDDPSLTLYNGEYIPSGSVGVNHTIGLEGMPKHRIIEITGSEEGGKTTLSDHIIAEHQRAGGIALVIDVEAKRDKKYSKNIGVDWDSGTLIYAAPTQGAAYTVEECFDAIDRVLTPQYEAIQGAKDGQKPPSLLIVWDSLGATSDLSHVKAFEDIDLDKSPKMASTARAIKNGLKEINNKLHQADATLILINWQYTSIGGSFSYMISGGGKALAYSIALRLELTKKSNLMSKDGKVLGSVSRVIATKNQVGSPLNESGVFIRYGKGIDNNYNYFFRLKNGGAISQKGSWYVIKLEGVDEHKFQGGFFGFESLVQNNPELYLAVIKYYQENTHIRDFHFTPKKIDSFQ